MYTQEEIHEEARSAQLRTIPWMLLIGILVIAVFYFYTQMEFSHYNPYNQHTMYYIMVCVMFVVVIFTCALPGIAYNNKKKQLEAENAEEERMKREEHYKKMEDMLKRMNNE